MSDRSDILTLYMAKAYKNIVFNGPITTKINGLTYEYDSRYARSVVRDCVIRPMYDDLNKIFKIESYVTTASQLPGSWQTSEYQSAPAADAAETGEIPNSLFNMSTTELVGSSEGYKGWIYASICNGLDLCTTRPGFWESLDENIDDPYTTDKLWLPSNFETTHRDRTHDGEPSYVNSKTLLPTDILQNKNGGTDGITDGRSGLWEMTAYDRASGEYVWLRSCVGGSYAATISEGGTWSHDLVSSANVGVRVALHLDLTALNKVLDPTSTGILTINSNGGTLATGISSSATGTENETYSLPTASQLTKTGYTLSGYTLLGGGSLDGFTYTFGSTDGTVTAQWTAITYTIAYTLNGGVLASKREEYTIESESYTLPTPTKPGYTFLGWTGSNGSSAQTTVTITKGTIGNKSYTANWESNYAEISLDVTINSNGRQYIIYILDENDNLKQQIMISKSGSTKTEVEKNKKFTILIYESLYMSATIDGETTRKKIYTNGVSDAQTMKITVSSARGQVDNWVIV